MKKLKFIFLALFCLTYLLGCSKTESKQKFTLNEAYQKSLKSALEWSVDAKLVHITSVDNPSVEDDGDGGERLNWNAIFHSVSLNESCVFSITGSKVEKVVTAPEQIDKMELIDEVSESLNSDKALEFAKEYYHLQLGKQWAKGYNYTLYKKDDQTILCVFGEDIDGYFSRVSFDFNTGQCLYAEHQIPGGGELWHDSELLTNDIWVTEAVFSPNYVMDTTVAIQCIVNPLTIESSSILKISDNGGLTWEDYLFDKPIIKVCFSKIYDTNETIYIITENDLYKLIDNQIYKMDSFTGLIDADIKEDKIVILTNDKILYSDDIAKEGCWNINEVPDSESCSLRIDSNGFIYLKDMQNNILQIKDNKIINIEQPLSDILGYEVIDKLFVYSYDKIAVFDDSMLKWTIFESPININNLCCFEDTLYIIGDNDIYTFSLLLKNFQQYNVTPSVPKKEISSIFHINNDNFYITKCLKVWDELK